MWKKKWRNIRKTCGQQVENKGIKSGEQKENSAFIHTDFQAIFHHVEKSTLIISLSTHIPTTYP